MTERKQKILLYIYLFYFLSPVIFDKNLLDFNIMQNLLYSILNIILIILILIFKLDIKKISINALILAGILLFPAMMLISSFLNSDYLLVQKDFLNYINITIFFFITVIILNSLSDKEFSRFVLPAVFIASIIIILFGFLQASGLSIQGIIRTDRPGSTLSNRTFASEYIATTFPVAAYFLFCEVNKDSVNKYKVIQFSLILTIFISYLILLRTRTAFFCIIFTLLFFLVILIIRKKKFSFTI